MEYGKHRRLQGCVYVKCDEISIYVVRCMVSRCNKIKRFTATNSLSTMMAWRGVAPFHQDNMTKYVRRSYGGGPASIVRRVCRPRRPRRLRSSFESDYLANTHLLVYTR